jgi:hypothetical protein
MNWEVLAPPLSPLASESLPPAVTDSRAVGHHYGLPVMGRGLELILSANTSLRAAARTLVVLQSRERPSLWTLRLWALRLGLYELLRPKPKANDWVFIVDATIAIGPHKALVILGARLGAMERQGFNLGHQEVATLGLCVLTHCDGLRVQRELEAAARAVGVPRLVVSDAGAEVKKGVQLFAQRYPEVDWNYDLTHRLARLLEHTLGQQSWWPDFLRQASHCRHACQQTAWSHLQPPAPRTKARWSNLEPLVGWGLKVLAYGRRANPTDPKFRRLFGWLGEQAERLAEARLLVVMSQAVCRIIKHQGINAQQVKRCEQVIESRSQTERTRAFGEELKAFLCEQASKVKKGETLLGSSDVIESLFGKYKALVQRSPLQAITATILLVAAWTSQRTERVIRQAMETVKNSAVAAWFKAQGAPSLLAQRRAAIGNTKGIACA